MPDDELGSFCSSEDWPRKAAVVPRATQGDSSCNLSVERLMLPFLRPGARGLVGIVAPPGGGKTTTLRHLAAVFSANAQIGFFDTDQVESALIASRSGIAVLAMRLIDPVIGAIATFELSPWTLDDCLEYLAACHRDRVSAVMQRLRDDSSLDMLHGSPELLALVMDRMVDDPSLKTARESLRQFVASLNLSASLKQELLEDCFARLGIAHPPVFLPVPEGIQFTIEQARRCRHEAIQRVFLGEWIADELSKGEIPECLAGTSGLHVLDEIAGSVAGRPAAIENLKALLTDDPSGPYLPMAASILLRANPTWRPMSGCPLNLSGADLRSAQWAGIDLESSSLTFADLTDADLSGACLIQVEAAGVRLIGANLRNAQLDRAKLPDASLMGADLSDGVCKQAHFQRADFTGANLTSADFFAAGLHQANLQRAVLHRTRFCSAFLDGIKVEEADFTHCDLTGARLLRVCMSLAKWKHVSLAGAEIRDCNLEGLEMEAADFRRADLRGSLLTGSIIPFGKFNGANLAQCGLAEIDWENADLRNADFTNSSFHLGSSRSGLVGSTVPCEGSRTGFYTDEFNEQDFKSPEEIRKACLIGADLRGAKVEKTDFYLVDLRGAKYGDSQRDHFVRCGAILVSRVA